MNAGDIRVERLSSLEQFNEFARLPYQVYGTREAWWPPDIQNEVDLLSGKSLLSNYLEMAPFYVRRDGRVVARVTAVINRRYIEHWNEPLGHLIHFEALDDEDDGVAAMLDAAVRWLEERGMRSVLAGDA